MSDCLVGNESGQLSEWDTDDFDILALVERWLGAVWVRRPVLGGLLVGGAAEEAYVRGLAGYVIALAAGPNAVVSVVAAPTASLTLLLPDLRQTAAYLGQSLGM